MLVLVVVFAVVNSFSFISSCSVSLFFFFVLQSLENCDVGSRCCFCGGCFIFMFVFSHFVALLA
jgi:hypothetical protein